MKLFLGFTGGKNLISRLIQKVDCEHIDGVRHPSMVNHVLIRTETFNAPSLVFQSYGSKGVHVSFFSEIKKAHSQGTVLRYAERELMMFPGGYENAWEQMQRIDGKAYDFRLILLYYIWVRVFKTDPKDSWILRLNRNNSYTCNETVMKVLCRNAVIFPWRYDPQLTPTRLFQMAFGMPSRVWFHDNPPVPW